VKITADDCRSCGACCVANGDGGDVLAHGYADLTLEDVERMTPHETRPDICRTFKVGGDICRDARRSAADNLESCSNLTRKGLL